MLTVPAISLKSHYTGLPTKAETFITLYLFVDNITFLIRNTNLKLLKKIKDCLKVSERGSVADIRGVIGVIYPP